MKIEDLACPEALTIDGGKYRSLILDMARNGIRPYAPDGIDCSQELMNVYLKEQKKKNGH